MRAMLSALVCLSLSLPPQSHAAGFYFREQEGWFWYEREPEPAPKEKPSPSPPPAPTAPTQSPLAESAPEGPRPLSAEWLREHIRRVLARRRAIDDPTPENVALYLYLQRVALDKSSRFAAATQRAVQLDPFLDEITQRPTATFAANLVNRQAGDNATPRCGASPRPQASCSSSAPTALTARPRRRCSKLLAYRYGFSISPVSVDGAPLLGGEFPVFRQDRGQAQALGVVSTPALFLVRPPDAVVPLSQGLLSLAQLQERVVVAAVQAGWISEEEFTRTRPVTTDLTLDLAELPANLPDEPEALLGALRALARANALQAGD